MMEEMFFRYNAKKIKKIIKDNTQLNGVCPVTDDSNQCSLYPVAMHALTTWQSYVDPACNIGTVELCSASCK